MFFPDFNKMAFISISGVSKSFANNSNNNQRQYVLKNVHLSICHKEFVILFGRNGSGKTTLLNIIAGILQPDNGEVRINGKHSAEEKVGFVFQNYRDSLLPWKTNAENIAFPLELEGMKKKERVQKVKALLNKLDITLPLARFPYQCSGGEQQLVAILRELITSPKLLLMDEPFSSLDDEYRRYLRLKIQEIWQKLEITIIFVSHDIDEALQLGDRILIISGSRGKIARRTVNINFVRPRTNDIIYSQKFRKLKKQFFLSPSSGTGKAREKIIGKKNFKRQS